MQLSLGLNETLGADLWRACDILRRDNNVGGVMQYTEHLAWLLFLKFFDQEEKNAPRKLLSAVRPTHQYSRPICPGMPGPAWQRSKNGIQAEGNSLHLCGADCCRDWQA